MLALATHAIATAKRRLRPQVDAEAMELPLTPSRALDAGFTALATARAIARGFVRRYGITAARGMIDAMQAEVCACERESRDLADEARRAGV
jgi:hypothetical protein